MAPIYLCKDCKDFRRAIRNRWRCPGSRASLVPGPSCEHCAETAALKEAYGDNRESWRMGMLSRRINKMVVSTKASAEDESHKW